MAVRISGPKFYAWDSNGNPLSFGKVYFYESGSSETFKDTYTGEGQTVVNTNPVILNAAGYAEIYLDGSYNVVVTDADDAEVWTQDPVSSLQADQWILCSSASYVATTSFLVSGNKTNDYIKDRRVRLFDGSVYTYATVISSSFSSGNTTVVVDDSVVVVGLQQSCVSIVSSEAVFSSFRPLLEKSVASMVANLDIRDGQYVNTASYYLPSSLTEPKGGAFYQIMTISAYTALTGNVNPDGYRDHLLDTGLVAFLVKQADLNVYQVGVVGDGIVDDTNAIDVLSYNLNQDSETFFMPKGTYRVSKFRTNNSNIRAENDAIVEMFFNDTPVMGQFGNQTNIFGVTFQSLESNLSQQRTATNGSLHTFERCKFIGFRDTTDPVDAWGMYIADGSSNTRMVMCGFDDNDQSDITFVGNCKNIILDQCYGISGVFHINFEPNVSTEFNENITLMNMVISKLAMLENGSGGTANRNITVQSCEIGEFKYDGAEMTVENCSIETFSIGTVLYFGELKLINCLALGPNIIADPYLQSIAFNAADAATNFNDWYMNARSGAIGGDQLDALNEDGVRFTRINPNSLSGVINFRPVNAIATNPGEYYLIAVTGRLFSGVDSAFMQIFDGARDVNCTLFRQSNIGEKYWTTELAIIEAQGTVILPKVGTYSTTTSSVDIRAITIHKVLGRGGNESTILNQFHGQLYGPRRLLPVSNLPVYADANLRGVQVGDTITLSTSGVESYWDGSAWV